MGVLVTHTGELEVEGMNTCQQRGVLSFASQLSLAWNEKVVVFGNFLLIGRQEQSRLNKYLTGSIGKQIHQIVF